MKITKAKYRFIEVDSSQWTGEEAGGAGIYLSLFENMSTKEGKLFLRYHYKKKNDLMGGRPSIAMTLDQARRLKALLQEQIESAVMRGLK